jgi:hypothetical protein
VLARELEALGIGDVLFSDAATPDEIRIAFQGGRAVLVHNRADGGTQTGLMLDGEHQDTRGSANRCGMRPESMQQACHYAR